ncbi:DUF2147 domain-containing protein [Membranihabitans marinus]
MILHSQSILGQWITIDDKNGNEVSVVEFYKAGDKINAKVVKILPKGKTTHCNNCPGERKNKSLINMDIIWDLEPSGNTYTNGTILDPRGGRTFDCAVWLDEDINKLNVRGSIGVSFFGRTQVWKRNTKYL